MTECSKQISEKWGLSHDLADVLCAAWEKGDSPYYLAEYSPQVSAQTDISVLWEVFDYLEAMEDLVVRRKRAVNAFKRAGKLTPALENYINHAVDAHEVDDILIPLRPNPRSKGQLAAKKGIDDLADLIAAQTEMSRSVEDLAAAWLAEAREGKDPSLKSVADVLQTVKEFLAERFAFDNTVRAMAREFLLDDGFFEIIPKNRKDERFKKYADKLIPVEEFENEELLRLFADNDAKIISLKLNVQQFRITELFRQYFITNPDSTSLDFICEIIDDMWVRLLHPSIEEDVKGVVRARIDKWASQEIIAAFTKKFEEEQDAPPVFVVDMSGRKEFVIVAISASGGFLGATAEKKPGDGRSFLNERLKQFFSRHRPARILVAEGAAEIPPNFIKQASDSVGDPLEVVKVKKAADPNLDPCSSEYMKQREFAMLDDRKKALYGLAITYLKPVSLMTSLGTSFYKVHPLQDALSEEKFMGIVRRVLEHARLRYGVSIKDMADSPVAKFRCVTKEILAAIKAYDASESIDSKTDILEVPGMTETVFRNIAGFILIPNAENLFDRSTAHPDKFPLIEDIINELTVSRDTIISNPDIMLSFNVRDAQERVFLQKKLIPQVQVAQRYQGIVTHKSKRKIKLSDLKEGSVVSGRVTNMTPFGVFVNINAVCDGLIHVSQLTDDYVEKPEQVVSVGDKVDVRILKVDTKKRRISLSMKNMGTPVVHRGPKGPKVKPTKGQLNNLAEHFKNR